MHINVLFVYAQKYITCICTEIYHLCVQGNILLLCVEMHHLCRGSILGGARARLCGRGVWAGVQAYAQFYSDSIHTSVHTQSSPKHCPVLNFGGGAGPNMSPAHTRARARAVTASPKLVLRKEVGAEMVGEWYTQLGAHHGNGSSLQHCPELWRWCWS